MFPRTRWTIAVASCALASGLVAGVVSCSGDDENSGNKPNDAGSDVKDAANEYVPPDAPPPVPTLAGVAAGAQHTCAIVTYGTRNVTYCFGKDSALGGPKSGLIAVASDGTVGHPTFLEIASSPGAGHTCGIAENKNVWCWGDDSLGQCAQGTVTGNVAAPTVAVDFQLSVAKAWSLALGAGHTCIVRNTDRTLACAGDNTACQQDLYDFDAGSGGEGGSSEGGPGDAGGEAGEGGGTSGPCVAGSPAIFTATDSEDGGVLPALSLIGAGPVHGCASSAPAADGGGGSSLFCWGDNQWFESGPAGKGTQIPASSIAATKQISALALGGAHTCFITSYPGDLYCFGKNDVHQANATATNPVDPSAMTAVPLPGGDRAQFVAAGANETCAIDTKGYVWCFGQGHGTSVEQVSGVKEATQIALGGGHACAIGHAPKDDVNAPRSLLCWGDNSAGQAGQTPGGTVSTPTAVALPATAP